MATGEITNSVCVEQEEWREIEGHKYYEVSNFGRVRCYRKKGTQIKTNQFVKDPWIVTCKHSCVGKWYSQVNLKGMVKHIHILVLEAFVGKRPVVEGCKVEARHLNDNKADNRLCNLIWGIQEDNIKDAKRNGRITQYGENHYRAKLTDEKVREIRRLCNTGQHYYKDVAKMFGVNQERILSIVKGTAWKHVE